MTRRAPLAPFARLFRLGACAVLTASAIAVAWPGVAAAQDGDTRYDIQSEQHTQEGIETHDGVSTESATRTATTTMRGSDGSQSTTTTSHTERTDGSRTDTQTYTSRHDDGSTNTHTATDDYDEDGNHSRTETDVTVDKDGNRTTTTHDQTFDSNGNPVSDNKTTVTDKTSPPPTHGDSPAGWTGVIGYTFVGEANGTDTPTGYKLVGFYNDAALYTVTMKKEDSHRWAVSSGTAVGSETDHQFESPGDGQWEIVVTGGGSARLQGGACQLEQTPNGSYTLKCDAVVIPGITWTGYIDGDLEEGPHDRTWTVPDFEISGIAAKPDGTLNASVKVTVIVGTAGSIGLPVQADIDFALTPTFPDSPSPTLTTGPKVDQEVEVDGPPMPMVIDEPGGQITVGFEVQAGQKVVVKLSANKAGKLTFEMRAPDGSLAIVGATNGDRYELSAPSAGQAGKYTVTIEAAGGGSGSFSLGVEGQAPPL
jgi:hypothetical protein